MVDSSFLVDAVIGSRSAGWAHALLDQGDLAAPHHMLAEATSVLRRIALAGTISQDLATMAYARLLRTSVDLLPYEPFADRIWELRGNVTPYDAWYVAIAEAYNVPLATLDRRLASAPGPRCEFLLPPI